MDPSSNPYQSPLQSSGILGATKMQPKEVLFGFQGRIPRQTFWIYSLAIWAVFFVLGFIIGFVAGPKTTIVDGHVVQSSPGIIFGLLMLIIYVPAIWIGLALQIKRWHDRAKSGWWVLIGLIPFVGAVWAFIECGCLRGTVGPNQFGEDPTN